MISHRLATRRVNPAKDRLQRARNALGGLNEHGLKVGPDMFDPAVISFAHGEGLQRPSPLAIAAGVHALLDTDKSTLDNYFFLQNHRPLTEKITRDFTAMGIDADTASTVCEDAGITKLYCGFLNAVGNPGDIFLTAPTHYHPVANLCDIFRAELQVVPTRAAHDFKLTAEDVELWVAQHRDLIAQSRVKGIMLFNPTMTGAVYSEAENRALAEVAQRHDLLILSDAIFAGTEFDGQATHQIAALPEAAERTVTVNGASKTMALANMRYGWACGPAPIIDRMKAYAVATGLAVPQVTKFMVDAAFADRDAYLQANRRECVARVELIKSALTRANDAICAALKMPRRELIGLAHEPAAGHSLLIHAHGFEGCRAQDGAPIADSADMVRHLLQTARVAMSPGIGFGFDDCTMRLAYACIGANRTYPYSRDAELSAAFAAVSGQPVPAAIPDVTAGYREGRDLIVQAFDRVQAALIDLALANAPRLRPVTGPAVQSPSMALVA